MSVAHTEEAVLKEVATTLLILAKQWATKDPVQAALVFGLSPNETARLAETPVADLHALIRDLPVTIFSPHPLLSEYLATGVVTRLSVLQMMKQW